MSDTNASTTAAIDTAAEENVPPAEFFAAEGVFRYPRRVADLRAAFVSAQRDDLKVDGIMVSHVENARYLTGFTGSNGLAILTNDRAIFITDGRYKIQSAAEVPGWERVVLPQGSSLAKAAAEQIATLPGVKTLAYEESHLVVKGLRELEEALPKDGTAPKLVGHSDLVEGVRQTKEADEITAIRRACVLVDECFTFICQTAKAGMTERELAWQIEVFIRTRGAERLSFESIVASGPNSALPHARPTDRKLGASGGPEFVIVDYGADLGGYCSDITRTFVVGGEPTPKMREMYETVRRAQQATLEHLRAGQEGKAVDTFTRDLITKDGYGEEFSHGLGHQLGRICHDGMAFSQRSTVKTSAGMVATVEPGVYVENLGGVRIEDDVVVTETGCEVLTTSTKELVVLS